MRNRQGRRVPRWLRPIGFSILGLIALIVLLYASIFVSSIWGRESIMIGTVERKYRVYVPATYNEGNSVPLVFAFHMYTGHGRMMEWTSHLNHVADTEGFIVVYPDGYKYSWADGSGQLPADRDGVDDIAFVSGLIDRMIESYAIDVDRIYATGFSNGGFLAQRLACEIPDRIAAVATVGATLSENVIRDCTPQESIPVMMINGDEDEGVPWEGISGYASVPGTVEHWTKVNGCADAPTVSLEPDIASDGTRVRHEVYTECQRDVEVVLYAIEGGGHTWPGGSKPVQLWGLNGRISQDIDASLVIWEFFQAHHR